jgi:hypothetical protein
MSVERLTAIERKIAGIQVLVAVNMALLIGVLWLMCTISGRVPR